MLDASPREDIDMITTRRYFTRWAVATFTVASVALGAISCAAGPAPMALDTVGRVDGSAALVAVIAKEDQVLAYVCDGDTGVGERFAGTMTGGHAELRSPGGALLSVDLRPGAAEGTFTADGAAPAHFVTTAATDDEAGYFTAEGPSIGDGFSAGWVELGDGTQTGVQSDGGGHKHRAPRLHHHRKPAPNGNPGIVPPGGGVEDGGDTIAPLGLPDRPTGSDDTLAPLGSASDGTRGDVLPLRRVADTVDEPTATVDGAGEVAPHRVGTTDLIIRRPKLG
jgi:hypothetical protein